MNGLWPPAFCVKQLLLHLILEVPDCPLGNSAFEVCIHAAVTDVLAVAFTILNECIFGKVAIVSMVLLYLNAMVGNKFFECNLGLDCLIQQWSIMELHVLKVGEVVDKNGSGLVLFSC